ncbi:hypothetical protein CCHR01_06510 [Colletotrichum chrysophilum]|uniref:Uncharacterized protein n=1 Tax=Colletotrichum chrysophilum TaxID=1836956 RepID=A0AAD9ALW5_9PEZI|nr:hypothetical protein CCHR01_06510 [Colletotrichum chrysophilum]
MLLNSSVFQMTSRFGDFGLYVASESFLTGEPYVFPGASLYIKDDWEFEDLKTERTSAARSNISTTAATVSEWERLDAIQCQNMYRPGLCNGLKDYHNVVLVVDGPGWTRDDLWNLSMIADRLWEPVIPRYDLNSLLMADQCNMSGNTWNGVPECGVDCRQLRKRDGGSRSRSLSWAISEPEIPWFIHIDDSFTWRNRTLYSATEGERYDDYRFGARVTSFEVSYCMAEPSMATCSVALSKPLMLAVVLSVFLKLVICVVVVRFIGPQEPLVTPGDAVMSFISTEDRGSFSGVVTQEMIRRRKRNSNVMTDVYAFESLESRHWVKKQQLRVMAIPRGVWVRTYGVLLIGIIAASVCLWQQLSSGTSFPLIPRRRGIKLNVDEASSFLYPVMGPSPFPSSVVIANIPQLFLSFWYLTYNSLITRLEMSKEWALLSVDYQPLRVTQPRGLQTSTYRLQLPYKYSIPMIILSAIGHWLLSNAVFIIVSQGSYYVDGDGIGSSSDPTSLSSDAVVSIGTASLPVLVLTILGLIALLLPILLSRRVLPGYMPIVGSNSLAISAACHVSPLAKVPKGDGNEVDARTWKQDATELQDLLAVANQHQESERSPTGMKSMVLYPLKWGDVKMPEDWYSEMGHEANDVGHLSFGTVADDPQPPKDGRWYR